MLKARGFSLSTKFILFAVVSELILFAGGLYTAYSYLTNSRIQLVQQMLLTQVDLIGKQLELDRAAGASFRFGDLNLDPRFHFQVVDGSGRVYFDSKVSQRNERQVVGQHTLFDLVRQTPKARGLQEFHVPQSAETYLGGFSKALGDYFVMGAIPLRAIELDVYRILERFTVLGILFCGFSFIVIVLYSIRLIRPVRRLTRAARELSNGNFEVDISMPPSGDEIGTLAEAFTLMTERVRELLKEEVHKTRIEKEVHSVADIQQSLLPEDSINNPRFQIEGYYKSATETGGDYWGYFETDRYLVMYVADATGHGLPSAMLTAAARGCFSAVHRFATENPTLPLTPSQLLRLANEAVLDSAQEELNMTMFVVVYDFESKTIQYANAGHYPAWLIRSEEGGPKIELLQGTGPRLGENAEFQSPKDQVTTFNENDILFLYTDGLIDCVNAQGEPLGKPLAKETILLAVAGTQDLATIRTNLVQKLEEFSAGQPLPDDITFAFMKRNAG